MLEQKINRKEGPAAGGTLHTARCSAASGIGFSMDGSARAAPAVCVVQYNRPHTNVRGGRARCSVGACVCSIKCAPVLESMEDEYRVMISFPVWCVAVPRGTGPMVNSNSTLEELTSKRTTCVTQSPNTWWHVMALCMDTHTHGGGVSVREGARCVCCKDYGQTPVRAACHRKVGKHTGGAGAHCDCRCR